MFETCKHFIYLSLFSLPNLVTYLRDSKPQIINSTTVKFTGEHGYFILETIRN